jgi:hypothetical protein
VTILKFLGYFNGLIGLIIIIIIIIIIESWLKLILGMDH